MLIVCLSGENKIKKGVAAYRHQLEATPSRSAVFSPPFFSLHSFNNLSYESPTQTSRSTLYIICHQDRPGAQTSCVQFSLHGLAADWRARYGAGFPNEKIVHKETSAISIDCSSWAIQADFLSTTFFTFANCSGPSVSYEKEDCSCSL